MIWDCIQSQWTVYVLVATIVAAYIVSRRKPNAPNYFQLNGIPFRRPMAVFGDFGDLVLRRESFYTTITRLYTEFRDYRAFGIHFFQRPALMLNDPALIRQMLVTDFDHFIDHPQHGAHLAALEPIVCNSLIMLDGDKWRQMRATLSPAFTGSRMRQMFQLIAECSERTVRVMRDKAAGGQPWVPEMRELFSYFANDVIATAAFGVEVNSVGDPQNRFYALGKKSMDLVSLRATFRWQLAAFTQWISKRWGTRMLTADVVRHFDTLVHGTIEAREKGNIQRPDMIQLLLQAKADGAAGTDGAKRAWSRDELTAQCYLFFMAGFETMSSSLAFVSHELMANPEIQERLRAEVDEVRAQLKGAHLGYDDLGRLKYMDMVISETLRKYPTPMVDRECRADITMTASDGATLQVPKGMSMMVPVIAIHRDPQYYPDPMRFDPERFGEENRHRIDAATYLPFGIGPRSCIGMRMALMELKTFLFVFLSSFTLERAATSQEPLVFLNSGLFPRTGPINVHLAPRAGVLGQDG